MYNHTVINADPFAKKYVAKWNTDWLPTVSTFETGSIGVKVQPHWGSIMHNHVVITLLSTYGEVICA